MTPNVSNIVAELRRQGWDVAISTDAARWTAKPVDRLKRSVTFANHPKDVVHVIRELRQQGFVWPPHANGHLDAGARVTSTPFPPQPNPDTADPLRTTATGKTIVVAVAPAPKPTTPADGDALIAALRDAKEYEKLAASDHKKCQAALTEATARAEEAALAYADARQALRAARDAFAEAFDPEFEEASQGGKGQ